MYSNSFENILHWILVWNKKLKFSQLKGDNSNIWKYSKLNWKRAMQIFHRDLTERKITTEKVFNWFNICLISLKGVWKRPDGHYLWSTIGSLSQLCTLILYTSSKIILPFPLYMLRFWMTYFLRSGCMFLIWVSPGSFFIGYKFQTLKRFISHILHTQLITCVSKDTYTW